MMEFDFDNSLDYDLLFQDAQISFNLWDEDLIQSTAFPASEIKHLADGQILYAFNIVIGGPISLDNLDDWIDIYDINPIEIEEALSLIREQTHELWYNAHGIIKLLFDKKELDKILNSGETEIIITPDNLADLIVSEAKSTIKGYNDENKNIKIEIDSSIVRDINQHIGWPVFRKESLYGAKINLCSNMF